MTGDLESGNLFANANTTAETLPVLVTSWVVAGSTTVHRPRVPFVPVKVTDVTIGVVCGDLTIAANGSWTFQKAPEFIGRVPPINYTLEDSKGGIDTSILSIVATQATMDLASFDALREDAGSRGVEVVETVVDTVITFPFTVNDAFSADVITDALEITTSHLMMSEHVVSTLTHHIVWDFNSGVMMYASSIHLTNTSYIS